MLEVAILDVVPGKEAEFETAFRQVSAIISSMSGHISHQLQHCVENNSRYILLVNWQSLEAHTIGFRTSPQYQEWQRLLHHFYSPFPTVEHYKLVLEQKT
jgi:heme-degrading monooxygenase HmoA